MYGQKSISQSLLDAVNTAMFEDIHPQAQSLLKHIKPEHHATYKPFLAKGTFNGSHKDKTDVLNAAKKAGHLVSENIEEIIEAWADMQKYVKDKAGPQPKGHIGQKAGTRYGGAGQKDDEREKETERLEKKKEMKKESFGDFKDRLIESLKGNQHKIDKNKNNKIDAQDFKILRAQKEEVELSEENMKDCYDCGVKEAKKEMKTGIPCKSKYEKGTTEYKESLRGYNSVMKNEEVELDEANKESKKDFDARQARLAAAGKETEKDPVRLKRLSSIPGYNAAMNLAKKTTKEEVELDEAGEVKTPKSLTVDTLAGPRKAPKGFEKDNEHTSAKVPLKTEGKRPESDTVPFVTDAPQSPKERLRSALGKVKKEMSNGY
jgi:hypothetical protein